MKRWRGLRYDTHRDVYDPSDDTFLLAEVAEETVRPGTRFLEVGCGAGLVAMAAAQARAEVVCTDVNPQAVRLTRDNAERNGLSVEAWTADLLEGLAVDGPFDVVAFNPPYLPTGPDDHVAGPLDLAFDGGLDGNKVVLRFAAQLADLEPLPETVLVVHSSLSDPQPLTDALSALGYDAERVKEEKHFQEVLTVWRFAMSSLR